MQFLATRLLITALMLHATFGCCLHHAHARESTDGDASATTCAHACGCMGHADKGHGSTAQVLQPASLPAAPARPGSHACDEVKCNFARTEISPENEEAAAINLLLPALPLDGVDLHPATASVAPDGLRPHCALRLHLFLAVLRL